LDEGLITSEIYQFFLAVTVLSMAATPFIIAAAPRLSDLILKLPLPERVRVGFYPVAEMEKSRERDHLDGITWLL